MKNIRQIALKFKELNIDCFLVGGCVRDEFLNIPTNDIDICLVGVTSSTKNVVMNVLNSFNFVKSVAEEVGKEFPVWIADIEDIGKVDFALARGEKSTGNSHRDFSISIDGVSIEQDLLRRDITINSMAANVLTGMLVDPFNGLEHLLKGIAHPTSEAFSEDPLRVIRAARFIARFNLTPSKELIKICRELTPSSISKERIGTEFTKAMKKAVKPSLFFHFLNEVGWLELLFKEVHDLIGVKQSPVHHPEGDAFTHTMMCVDEANDFFTRVVMLCHDLGKINTTVINGSKITAHGHEKASVPLTLDMLSRIKFENKKFRDKVATLVESHMIHTQQISEKVIRKTLRKLLSVGLNFSDLVEVCRCDVSGRLPLKGFTPDIGQERAQELIDNNLMEPVVTGAKLLEIGMSPGKSVGVAVKKALELQDRGTLNKDNWFKVLKGTGLIV